MDDAWVVYTVEGAMLHVRVFTASGDILIDQRRDIELPSYGAVYLKASSSPAGAAVIVS